MKKPRLIRLILLMTPLMVLGATVSSQGWVQVSGNITSNTTWFQADTVYWVVGDVNIQPGVTLTIEPGVIVKFNLYRQLNVYGKLMAVGGSTADSLIYFTSIRDDNVGGDTNGDGNATIPDQRNWKSIKFYDPSDDNSLLKWCIIRYGGSGNIGVIELSDASPTIAHSIVAEGYYGIACRGTSSPLISQTEIQTCIMTPIAITLDADPTFDAFVFSERDNGYDALGLLGGDFYGSSFLRIRDAVDVENITYLLLESVTIRVGASFDIQPGIVIKFLNYNVGIFVEGTLVADGTQDSIIVFTSVKDDNYGNPQDTNNDGSQTSPAVGDWRRIKFLDTSIDPDCILDNCVIKFGSWYQNPPMGAVEIANASPTVSNCLISDNTYGISIRDLSNPQITDNEIVNSTYVPILMSISANPTFSGNQFVNNGYIALGIIGDVIGVDSQLLQRDVAGYENITYLVNNNVTISSGARVTVEPGVVVKFRSYKKILVEGALVAEGTPDSLIVFTSEKDDYYGNPGDTNDDGSSTVPAHSNWASLNFLDTSDDAVCVLRYCVLKYGGYSSSGGVELSNAGPTISHCLISDNYYGIECDGNSDPNILDNQINYSYSTPIYMSLKSNPFFSGNSFEANGYKALGIIEGTLSSDATLYTRTVAGVENMAYLLLNSLTIGPGATLTIRPGVVIKPLNYGRSITVQGGLSAQGTADSLVVFTSVKDDANGGDTNNDGSQTSPSASDWSWIRFEGTSIDSLCVLDHCNILFGGWYSGNAYKGVIQANSASPTVSNCTIANAYYGIVCRGTSYPQISANQILNITYLPITISLISDPLFDANQLFNNAYTALGLYGETLAEDVTIGRRDLAGYENITWILDENLSVTSGATLTIEPGVVVKMRGNKNLTVEGTLVADGTPDSLIIFTSEKDDGFGNPEDTNNDGSITQPAPGNWSYVRFEDTSDDLNCVFDNCVIRYGGSYNHGGVVLDNAGPTISNSIFSYNDYGLELQGSSAPTIANNWLENNTYTPILMSLVSDPSFSGNSFSANGYKALGIIGETLASDVSWGKRAVAGDNNIVYLVTNDLTVGAGAILTIEPGLVIKFLNQNVEIHVKKALTARGGSTQDSLIVFTSAKDDFYGGDTNNDGAITSPATGDWGRINFGETSWDPLCHLENCVIRYGGGYSSSWGAVEMTNASPTILNCIINDNQNGVVAHGASDPSINGCDIYGSHYYGIKNIDQAFCIDAQNNWWGDDTGPLDESDDPDVCGGPYNPGGLGDEVSDGVDYEPWAIGEVLNPQLGDVSMNGEIMAYDAALVLRHIAELDTLTEQQLELAEVSGNGDVTAYDASLILQYVAGIITFFPAESTFAKPAFASLGGGFGIDDISVAPGDTFTVFIRVENGQGLFSSEMDLGYDPTILKLQDISTTPLTSSFMFTHNILPNGRVKLALAGSKPLKEGGNLLTITFSTFKGLRDIRETSLTLSRVGANERDFTSSARSAKVRIIGLPSSFKLSQNYPNPFNPSTCIAYQLPSKATVQLRIYNALGQLVVTLVDEEKEAGYHQAFWDGKDNMGRATASGVYFCRLIAGEHSQIRKMLLIR